MPSAPTAHINRIATAVPPHDIHRTFQRFGEFKVAGDARRLALLHRMIERSGIEHRYACVPHSGTMPGVEGDFYRLGRFPDTAERMRAFEVHAPPLAEAAVERLDLGRARDRISHLIVTCCTGFSAPGLDFELMARCDLPRSVERTMVGFMGCYAAINGLKLAHHIVRSEPDAHVLLVNLELCSLHLQDTAKIDQLLSFLLFADGCAASLITADAVGAAIDGFSALVIPDTADLITWSVRDSGFEMVLSGKVPAAIRDGLRGDAHSTLGPPDEIGLWAVHPGGRTVLDAVQHALQLHPDALAASREVLRRYGNMSSPTVMFVLEVLMRQAAPGARGCAISFGPGMVAEIMRFHAVTPFSAPERARPGARVMTPATR